MQTTERLPVFGIDLPIMEIAIQTEADKEQLMENVATKVGIVRALYQTRSGADELIDLYGEYQRDGASIEEIKLFREDLELFLDTAIQMKHYQENRGRN